MDELLAPLRREDFTRGATIGGGDWSAKDLVGHITTWEELALRTIREWDRGEVPWVESSSGPFSAPATGKVAAFNARTVEEKRGLPPSRIRAGAKREHRELTRAIQGLSDEQWNAKAPYRTPRNRRRHLRSLLGSILAGERPFDHIGAHLQDLQAYVRSLG